MKIIVDPSTFDCLNMGDVAMLQVAVNRLLDLWPSASIQVFTSHPARLYSLVANVQPLDHNGRLIWFSNSALLGGLKAHTPATISELSSAFNRRLRRRNPEVLKALLRLKARLGSADARAVFSLFEAIEAADLYVVSGAITICDKGKGHARIVLNTLEMAIKRGIPTMMFSQGIGPVHDPGLIARARAVLPLVNLIAVRESLKAPALLSSLGVTADRVVVTGDDAIEGAYLARPLRPGGAIGVNLRVGRSSDVEASFIEVVRPVLHEFARQTRAPLVPIPIAHHSGSDDPRVIRGLLAGYDDSSDGGRTLDTPARIIEQTGRCRVVVTGAYHAAVFSLSQGVPTVCLAYNSSYSEKFLGLANQFGPGCDVVVIGSEPYPQEKMAAAFARAWRHGETVRESLLKSAVSQIAASRDAYQRVADALMYKRKKVA